MQLAVIVVSYRRADLLDPCLQSVEEALRRVPPEAELIVVDNASHDGSAQLVRDSFPAARLIELPENIGFAGAVNRGTAATEAEWLALVNSDAVVMPDFLAELLAHAQNEGVGSCAAQVRFSGRDEINSAGLDVDGLGVAHERLVGAPLEAAGGGSAEVFGASAGAALYRRAMLDDVGGFDASFFMYLEDVDLAWRARMAGWRCLYVPGAVAHHHHSASAGHGSSFKHFHVGRNRIRVLAKNADSRLLARRAPAILAYEVGYVTFAALAHRTLAPLRGRLRGLREWGAYRHLGAVTRRPLELGSPRGFRAALARRRAYERY